ncbi:MAG: 2-oxo-4-hydroxy-4-carboxy-5-ureidoimidazoline decarboxylase [Pseudomonadota bacterium]|nr:2-oxo-4-hydroxy-4-carboxy-5-ureidoimidazoline decarboxylase [Pseudomonadota bacterium]
MTLEEFNLLNNEDAKNVLLEFCSSKKWVKSMINKRPFIDIEQMLNDSKEVWSRSEEEDLMEAFSSHAKIGDISSIKNKYSKARKEQGQIIDADESVIKQLFEMNKTYELKNGFIFIVFATGKTANQMAEILKKRLLNTTEQELVNAAIQQNKITNHRINIFFDQG